MHSSTYIPKSELDKTAGFVLHFIKKSCVTHRDIADNQLPKAELFNPYSRQDLQLEDTEGMNYKVERCYSTSTPFFLVNSIKLFKFEDRCLKNKIKVNN